MGNYWTSENEGGESYVADWSTVKALFFFFITIKPRVE